MHVAGLLLAAGAGSRLGTPKALVILDGQPLVARGAGLLAAAGCVPVLVTVGAAADEVLAALAGAVPRGPGEPPAAQVAQAPQVVRVDGWAEGVGASLRAGLGALGPAAAPAVDAVVVTLVDQPFVSPVLVRRLITAAGGAGRPAAVVAGYGGQPRNPVLLRREIWPEVTRLAVGDVGARAWLRAHPERVLVVGCDDVGRPDDLDTPADLARLGAATPGRPDQGTGLAGAS